MSIEYAYGAHKFKEIRRQWLLSSESNDSSSTKIPEKVERLFQKDNYSLIYQGLEQGKTFNEPIPLKYMLKLLMNQWQKEDWFPKETEGEVSKAGERRDSFGKRLKDFLKM